PEVEFRKVAMQMVLAAMLIGGHVAARVLAIKVVDSLVRSEGGTDLVIYPRVVSHDASSLRDVLLHDRPKGLGGHALNVEGTHLPAALVNGKHLALLAEMRALALFLSAADVGLVGLDDPLRAFATENDVGSVAHRLANPVPHEPRSLQGDPESAVELVRTDALLAGGHKVDRLEPQVQLDVAVFEDGPDTHGKRFT